VRVNEAQSTSDVVQWIMGYGVWQHEQHFFPESNCWMEVSLSLNQSWCFFCGEAKGSRSSIHNAVADSVLVHSAESFSVPLG